MLKCIFSRAKFQYYYLLVILGIYFSSLSIYLHSSEIMCLYFMICHIFNEKIQLVHIPKMKQILKHFDGSFSSSKKSLISEESLTILVYVYLYVLHLCHLKKQTAKMHRKWDLPSSENSICTNQPKQSKNIIVCLTYILIFLIFHCNHQEQFSLNDPPPRPIDQ